MSHPINPGEADPGGDALVRSFARDLRARNLSPRTIETYLGAVNVLRASSDLPLDAHTADSIRAFLDTQLAQAAPASVSIRYRALRQFFAWCAQEGITDGNIMAAVRPPFVPEKPVQVLTDTQIRALLKACEGRGLEERRDTAMIRLFLEPGGLRVSEMVGLARPDVDFELDVVYVMGKGRRGRAVPFGARTGQALDRYCRERDRAHGLTGPLWVGQRGALTRSGVQQMLRRRAAKAGIGHLHPHMLRHTAAHEWLVSGGQETDAMRLFGWRSRQMLERYGSSAAVDRAHAAARRLGLGDRY